MKKISILFLILLLLIPAFAQGGKEVKKEDVNLVMGSWRADDYEALTAFLAEYTKLNPHVHIDFKPTNPPDYNAALALQLESGTGPDLFYSRSYEPGAQLFEKGYAEDLSDLESLKNFSDSSLDPWRTADKKQFAMPLAAVSHAVYYNKNIFKNLGLAVPKTWEELLQVSKRIKDAGITPFSNGLADEWDINETFFMGIIPSFVGTSEERVKYENGELPLNDAKFKSAFAAMKEIAQYLPPSFSAITYNDARAMFLIEQAAMNVNGSWEIDAVKSAPFEVGVFALPAPKGLDTGICFHPDAAVAMNKATKHPEEVKAFLQWLGTKEGAQVAAKYLPNGFFPMINDKVEIENKVANEFLSLNAGKKLDARFVWPKLLSLYVPMNQAVIKVMKGEFTVDQAADSLENARNEN